MLVEGKGRWELSGRVPRRVDAATKQELLELIDRARRRRVGAPRACSYLELPESRAWRWRRRRDAGCSRTGERVGTRCTVCCRAEVTAIVALFDEWGEVDRVASQARAPRQLPRLVWVSPASVRRVLAAQGLVLKRPRRAVRSAAQAVPGLGGVPPEPDLDLRRAPTSRLPEARRVRGRGHGHPQVDHRSCRTRRTRPRSRSCSPTPWSPRDCWR